MGEHQTAQTGKWRGLRWLLLGVGVIFLLVYASGHVESYTEKTAYEQAIRSIKEQDWAKAQQQLQDADNTEDAHMLLKYVKAQREFAVAKAGNSDINRYAAALSELNDVPDTYRGNLHQDIMVLKREIRQAWQARLKQSQAERAKRQAPKVGMTEEEVRKSSWGEPKYINQTKTEKGVVEQWVYPAYQFVYLENGKVTIVRP